MTGYIFGDGFLAKDEDYNAALVYSEGDIVHVVQGIIVKHDGKTFRLGFRNTGVSSYIDNIVSLESRQDGLFITFETNNAEFIHGVPTSRREDVCGAQIESILLNSKCNRIVNYSRSMQVDLAAFGGVKPFGASDEGKSTVS